ncbi:MAG: hypothetical protein HXL58_01660 [Solobacterium sp.]|nr:hypothetical protein [Solobacterium sp.]
MVYTLQTISTYVIKLLIACMFLIPVHAEETPSPSPSPTPETQNNDDLIGYLERQKAEQAEKEKQEQEQKEKQENLDRASFDSASDVIYGMANKFGYYFIGYTRANNYSNYVYYGYFFTDLTQFERVGNSVKFTNGKGKYVYCTNGGGCSFSDLDNQFTIPNWQNIQSNIYELDYPSITSIDKGYLHLIDFFTKTIAAVVSFSLLYSLCNRLFINKGKRG